MKTKIKLYLSTMLLIISYNLQGQDSNLNYRISLDVGFTFAGPVGPMANYLSEQGFDAQNVDSWFFGPTDYPVKTPVGGSLSLNYSWRVRMGKRVNIQVGSSNLGRVSGLSNSGASIAFEFKSLYGAIFYSYQKNPWILKIGPSILLNTINPESYTLNQMNTKDTKVTLGVFGGLGLRLWSSKRTYGKLNLDYIYALPNKLGPYDTNSNPDNLPEKHISFRHGTSSFTIGVHL